MRVAHCSTTQVWLVIRLLSALQGIGSGGVNGGTYTFPSLITVTTKRHFTRRSSLINPPHKAGDQLFLAGCCSECLLQTCYYQYHVRWVII